MEQVYEQRLTVGMSACDADRRLSHPAAFNLLQDISALHGALLGVGPLDLEKRSLFWLIVKVKMLFDRRPGLGEEVLLRTWPDRPGTLRFTRSYELVGEGGTLMRAKTEWAVIDVVTRRVIRAGDVFPAELAYDRPPACTEAFPRIGDRFDGIEPFASYTVSSSDIDLGGHMNNAAYPRALFGAFTVAERRAMDPRSVDLIYRAPCYEGETLAFRRRENSGALEVCASRGDETVLLARLL